MCEKQQTLMHQVNKTEGHSDAVSGSDTSRWSSPSSLQCGTNSSHCSDHDDTDDLLTDRTLESNKWPGPECSKKGKTTQGPHRQKIKTANVQPLKLPPIKPLQDWSARAQCASLSRISDLKSQVWALQQQLIEAHSENKLLRRIQNRHTVALQHFQESEDSISQIVIKHSNEVRVIQSLLQETRSCRDNLARQLQATESRLLSTKTSLLQLQQLNQDRSLLERGELTLRLNKANAKLGEKDKRIADLERNLELCRASFNRQIATEQRKFNKARQLSCYLQEQVYQQSMEIQERQRELETHNIYYHRFTKKGRENKMVQTDGFIPLPTEAASLTELENTETEQRPEEQESSQDCFYIPVQDSLVTETPQTEVLADVTFEETHQDSTETCADTCEQSSCAGESLESQTEELCTEEEHPPETPQELEEEQETEEQESEMPYIFEKSQNTTKPKRRGHRLNKVRAIYTFKQSIENLHNGKPAYSSVDLTPCERSKGGWRQSAEGDGVGSLSSEMTGQKN